MPPISRVGAQPPQFFVTFTYAHTASTQPNFACWSK